CLHIIFNLYVYLHKKDMYKVIF
ncbi:CPBP family intramembrane metalloprotease, partial [Lactobacillus crispatus]